MMLDIERSRKIAHAIDLMTIKIQGANWSDIIGQFSSLEEELLLNTSCEEESIEIRRRICEAKIREVAPPDPARMALEEGIFDAIWQEMLTLGFSNEERRMSMQTYRIIYLLENSENKEKIAFELSSLRKCVEKLAAKLKTEMGDEFCRTYERLQQKFVARFEKGTACQNIDSSHEESSSTHQFVFQASGKNFSATEFLQKNSGKPDAREVSTLGNFEGRIVPHNAILIQLTADHKSKESLIVQVCNEIAFFQEELRSSGADNFILFIRRKFTYECNEEFSRRELQAIARLDCDLFYTARPSDQEMAA